MKLTPTSDINAIWATVKPGDVLEFADGEYKLTKQLFLSGKSGTAAARIRLVGNWGKVIIKPAATYTQNPSANGRGGCYISGDYIDVVGIRFTEFKQKDSFVWNGLLAMNCNHCIFDRIEVDNCGSGFYIQGNSTDNLVINSDFHHNYDPLSASPGNNADGMNVAYTAKGTNNIVRYCRAWANSDDGFDCFQNLGFILYEGNWSWNNGWKPGTTEMTPGGNGVGFKLGTIDTNPGDGQGNGSDNIVLRSLVGNIAYKNRLTGFHQEWGICRMELKNNASVKNGEHGYLFNWKNLQHSFTNNYAWDNDENNAVTSALTKLTNNAFGGNGYAEPGWVNKVSAADFISDVFALDAPRKDDGSLPDISFLKLTATSDLQGIGPFGTGVIIVPPPAGNLPPTANAGKDQTVTLPIAEVVLAGSGTDPEGGAVSYKWTGSDGSQLGTSPTLKLNEVDTAGVYKFLLTVTDNKGLTATDEVTVTVLDKAPVPVKTLKGTCYYYADDSVSKTLTKSKTLFKTIKVYSDKTVE